MPVGKYTIYNCWCDWKRGKKKGQNVSHPHIYTK